MEKNQQLEIRAYHKTAWDSIGLRIPNQFRKDL